MPSPRAGLQSGGRRTPKKRLKPFFFGADCPESLIGRPEIGRSCNQNSYAKARIMPPPWRYAKAPACKSYPLRCPRRPPQEFMRGWMRPHALDRCGNGRSRRPLMHQGKRTRQAPTEAPFDRVSCRVHSPGICPNPSGPSQKIYANVSVVSE